MIVIEHKNNLFDMSKSINKRSFNPYEIMANDGKKKQNSKLNVERCTKETKLRGKQSTKFNKSFK